MVAFASIPGRIRYTVGDPMNMQRIDLSMISQQLRETCVAVCERVITRLLNGKWARALLPVEDRKTVGTPTSSQRGPKPPHALIEEPSAKERHLLTPAQNDGDEMDRTPSKPDGNTNIRTFREADAISSVSEAKDDKKRGKGPTLAVMEAVLAGKVQFLSVWDQFRGVIYEDGRIVEPVYEWPSILVRS